MNPQFDEGTRSIQSSNGSTESELGCTDATPLTPVSLGNRHDMATNSFSVSFVDRRDSAPVRINSRTPSAIFNGSRRWKIAFFIVFLVNILLLSLIVVGLAMRVPDRKNTASDEKYVLKMYSDFFMTKAEADALGGMIKVGALKSKASRVVDVHYDLPGYNCTRVTPINMIGRIRTDNRDLTEMMLYHGCCETNQTWVAHNTLRNAKNEEVQIVQYEERQQYFFQDTCVHARSCTIPCTCRQLDSHVMAVVSNDDGSNVRIEMVMYPGTCKCINCDMMICGDQG